MRYRWQSIEFEAPPGNDDSTILVVDAAMPPQWNLGVRVDALPPGPAGLATYVAGLPVAPGATQTGKSSRKVAGRDAAIVACELALKGGALLKQQQALVAEGAQVYIFTMTAAQSAEKTATAAFDKLLTTLTWSKS